MMSALMATTALVAQGASNEEVGAASATVSLFLIMLALMATTALVARGPAMKI